MSSSHVSPYLFADKPAGCVVDSFAKLISERLQFKVFNLKNFEGWPELKSSGAVAFARDPDSTALYLRLLTDGLVKRKYLLWLESVSPKPGGFVDTLASPSGTFRLLHSQAPAFLYEIESTSSGKQILFDLEKHGLRPKVELGADGSVIPCIHCSEIMFSVNGRDFQYLSLAPRWFARTASEAKLYSFDDPLFLRWLAAVDRRERLLRSLAQEASTIRWIHNEGDPLRAEALGDYYSLSWFGDGLPENRDLESLNKLTRTLGWKNWYLQLRGNRGQQPNVEQVMMNGDVPKRWVAPENGLRFEFRLDTGLSPGLFLDQRQNRAWVRSHARGANVLNLFCYTSGFSVAAAAGGAKRVVSVDVSKPFLDWSRTNFALNQLSVEEHEFRAIDSREYLLWANKKGLRFDLIICDPPSFGRSRAGIFRIEKDFAQLVNMTLDLLAPGGRVLVSSNFEVWSEKDFKARLQKICVGRARILETPTPDWDFELPGQPRNMKSVFLSNS